MKGTMRNFKHGHTSVEGKRVISKAYTVWQQMKDRCNNPHSAAYANYGGRGISYDPSWELFANFFADMGDPPKGRFLDRRDNSLGYSKSNCRWVTRTQNNRNQRSNVIVEYNGKRLLISEWAELLGLKYITLYMRLQRKMPLERALSSESYDMRGK